MIAFIEGPAWYAALTIFVVFSLWRLGWVLLMGGDKHKSPARASAAAGAIRNIFVDLAPRGAFLKRGKVWFVALAGYAFHLGLFAVLLFAAPHVDFIEQKLLGFGWTPMPYWGFIVTAEIAFAGLLLLWIRRFVDPVTRLISRLDDHLAAGLTFIVMLTGCLALGQQSVFLRGLHMGFVELWLVYFPFSSLFHTFTWPLSRGYSGALFGRRGIRA
ncbi:MAG TPA: hypothetical protein ENH05_03750 [Rhizobiales bacterium]|nr:hypothetical protein BMS3Bbin10_02276 [bacterium BMS3Bbin10]HDO51833.1 hypothetical protein [Hyphomicrobiales bacterium]